MKTKRSEKKYNYQSITIEKEIISEIQDHIKQHYRMNISVAEYVRTAVKNQMELDTSNFDVTPSLLKHSLLRKPGPDMMRDLTDRDMAKNIQKQLISINERLKRLEEK